MTPAALIRLVVLTMALVLMATPAAALAAAPNDVTTVQEDSPPQVIDVLKNDDEPNTVPNTSQISSVEPPSHGTTSINQDRYDQIDYTPSLDYCGPDSFSYTGAYGTATVSVTVTCVDDAPKAFSDNYPEPNQPPILEDSGAAAYDVLSNDTDVDGGRKEITAIGAPRFGAAGLVGEKIRYAPRPNLCGTDSVGYTLNDSIFLDQKAFLSVDVRCVQDLPVANNDVFTVGFGTGTTFLPVVANDTDADDLTGDNDPIPIIGVTQPLNGTTQIAQGGDRTDQIAYTPRTGFCGTDSFLYSVFRDEVPQAQVTVTVPCPAPPSGGASGGGGSVFRPIARPVASARAGAPKLTGTTVGVPLSCTTAASCTVSLGLTTTTAGASAAARKKKAVVIGKAKVTLRPGQKRTATVKLNAAGKRALKKSRKLKAKLVVKLGTKTISTRTITFKAARKR